MDASDEAIDDFIKEFCLYTAQIILLEDFENILC